jgi:hypothetical protein
MRVLEFNVGKIGGRLIMRGDRHVERLVMLWKEGKYKSIRLSPIIAVQDFDQAIEQSLEEAKDIARKIFGKKDKNRIMVAPVKPVDAPVVTPKPVQLESPVKPEVSEKPIKKGFKSEVTGVLLKAGITPQVTTKDGEAESYKTFSATIESDGDVITVNGNDIRRALADVDAQPGDKIKLVHVRNDQTPNGFQKKVFTCSVIETNKAVTR